MKELYVVSQTAGWAEEYTQRSRYRVLQGPFGLFTLPYGLEGKHISLKTWKRKRSTLGRIVFRKELA